MSTDTPVIEIKNLTRRYGKLDAVNGLSLTVRAGKCYGFFGRNGAGKTTTIKCLLNLLRPNSGTGARVRTRPAAQRSGCEIAPHLCAGHGGVLSVDDRARARWNISPRSANHWNGDIEADLLKTLSTRPEPEDQQSIERPEDTARVGWCDLSRTGTAGADEPTSGLDPIVRREFIGTVIGAYQSGDPGSRTVFVSTHLILFCIQSNINNPIKTGEGLDLGG